MIIFHTNKHITGFNIYIQPRNVVSPHYATLDTDITTCIQQIIGRQNSHSPCMWLLDAWKDSLAVEHLGLQWWIPLYLTREEGYNTTTINTLVKHEYDKWLNIPLYWSNSVPKWACWGSFVVPSSIIVLFSDASLNIYKYRNTFKNIISPSIVVSQSFNPFMTSNTINCISPCI